MRDRRSACRRARTAPCVAWRSSSSVFATKSWRAHSVGSCASRLSLMSASPISYGAVRPCGGYTCGAGDDAVERHPERGARTLVEDPHRALRRGHREPHVELRDQRIGRVHVEVRSRSLHRGLGVRVDVDLLEPRRSNPIADPVGALDRVRLHVDRQVQILDVDVADVEHRRRRVRVDAGAEAGLLPRIERGDDADDRSRSYAWSG